MIPRINSAACGAPPAISATRDRIWRRTLLLACGVLCLRINVPRAVADFGTVTATVAVYTEKRFTLRQTSPTDVEETGCVLIFRAVVAGTITPPAVATLRNGGVTLELTKSSATEYSYTRNFSTRAQMEQALPPGTYTLDLGSLSTQVTLLPNDALALPRVSNYTELQRWIGTSPITVTVAPTPASSTVNLAFSLSQNTTFSSTGERAHVSSTGPSTTIPLSLFRPDYAPSAGLFGQVIISDNRATTVTNGSLEQNWNTALTFPVTRTHLPPTISTHPVSMAVSAGTPITFAVTATGNELSYLWRKNSINIPGGTSGTLSLPAPQVSDSGQYSVIVSNNGGAVVSAEAQLTVTASIQLPIIAASPPGKSLIAGVSHTLALNATGTPPLLYQWFRDGTAVAGATTSALTFEQIRLSDAGLYTATVTNAAGTVTTAPAEIVVTPITRISNLSIRTSIGGATGSLTVGITIGGEAATGTKPVLMRAVGPTLGLFGVSGALPDPQIALLSGSTVVAQNDDWSGSAQISSANAAVGAFQFVSDASKDSALAHSTGPGSYTLRITGAGPSSGLALTEVYDASPGATFFFNTPRLTNVSALTHVGTGGDILIAGFTLTGSAPKTVLVRGVGPTLAPFGVSNVLVDPRLELFAGGATGATAANDNWGAAPNATQVASVASSVGAFPLSPESRDAVLLVTLPPGNYTAQVSGVNNTTGMALVEVYEIP